MKQPGWLSDSSRCPYCSHPLVDHDVLDWSDYESPVVCASPCTCQVVDPDILQRIADAHFDRPD